MQPPSANNLRKRQSCLNKDKNLSIIWSDSSCLFLWPCPAASQRRKSQRLNFNLNPMIAWPLITALILILSFRALVRIRLEAPKLLADAQVELVCHWGCLSSDWVHFIKVMWHCVISENFGQLSTNLSSFSWTRCWDFLVSWENDWTYSLQFFNSILVNIDEKYGVRRLC